MTGQSGAAVQSWLDLAAAHRGSDRFQLSYAAFQAILHGDAPHLSTLASSVDLPESEAIDLLHRMADEGRIQIDSANDTVVAAGGLSLKPTRHKVTMHGRTFWVWCALDAVGIPAALGLDATAESVCRDTGEHVTIELKAGHVIRQQPETLLVGLTRAETNQSLCDDL